MEEGEKRRSNEFTREREERRRVCFFRNEEEEKGREDVIRDFWIR